MQLTEAKEATRSKAARGSRQTKWNASFLIELFPTNHVQVIVTDPPNFGARTKMLDNNRSQGKYSQNEYSQCGCSVLCGDCFSDCRR